MKLYPLLYASFVFVLTAPTISFGFCFDEAGKRYGINPALLVGIARAESSLNAHAINKNSNGSVDLGLMQINSQWLQKLQTSEEKLLDDACLNVTTGAYILRQCIDRHGYTWEAVGCYNAHSKGKRMDYAWKIFYELKKEGGPSRHKGRNTTVSTSGIKGRQSQSSFVFRVRDVTETMEIHP
jgi:Transglycosylase SLT domain